MHKYLSSTVNYLIKLFIDTQNVREVQNLINSIRRAAIRCAKLEANDNPVC